MAHSDKTKTNLRDDFINKRLPLTLLCEKYQVSYATAQTWKKKAAAGGDDWEAAKTAASMNRGTDIAKRSVQDFEVLFDAVYSEIMNDEGIGALEKVQALASLSDSKIKTVKAAGMQDIGKAKLGVAFNTLSELTEFIKNKHPEKLNDLIPILMPFGEYLSAKNGNY